MTAEEYMMRLKEKDDQLCGLLHLQAILSRRARDKEQAAPGSGAPDMAQSRALCDQILTAYRQREQMLGRMRRLIDSLPDQRERKLLGLHYLLGLKPEEVAVVLGCSLRQCYRLKRNALMHLEARLFF